MGRCINIFINMNFREFWLSRKAFRIPSQNDNEETTKIDLKKHNLASCHDEETKDIGVDVDIQSNKDVQPNFISHILKKYSHVINKCDMCNSLFEKTQDLEEHKELMHESSKDKGLEQNNEHTNEIGEKSLDENLLEYQAVAFSHLEAFLLGNPHITLDEKEFTIDSELAMSDDIECFINHMIPKMTNFGEFEKEIHDNDDIFDRIEHIQASGNTSANKTMKAYRKSNTGKKMIYDCTKCNQTFLENRHLKEHQVSHLETIYSCIICDKIFRQQRHLESHKLKHMETLKVFCKFCDKSLPNNRSLKMHMVSHKEKFECTLCGKVFNNKAKYLKHLNFHKREKKVTCDFCAKAFKTERGLKAHKNLLHSKQKNLKCDQCEKQFDKFSYLKWRKHTITLPCSRLRFTRKAKSQCKHA